jgi:hypothetical protein
MNELLFRENLLGDYQPTVRPKVWKESREFDPAGSVRGERKPANDLKAGTPQFPSEFAAREKVQAEVRDSSVARLNFVSIAGKSHALLDQIAQQPASPLGIKEVEPSIV